MLGECVYVGFAFWIVQIEVLTNSPLQHWLYRLSAALTVIGVVYITGEEIRQRLRKRLR